MCVPALYVTYIQTLALSTKNKKKIKKGGGRGLVYMYYMREGFIAHCCLVASKNILFTVISFEDPSATSYDLRRLNVDISHHWKKVIG